MCRHAAAILLFIPLLIVACLISMYREQTTASQEKTDDTTAKPELPLTTVGR